MLLDLPINHVSNVACQRDMDPDLRSDYICRVPTVTSYWSVRRKHVRQYRLVLQHGTFRSIMLKQDAESQHAN